MRQIVRKIKESNADGLSACVSHSLHRVLQRMPSENFQKDLVHLSPFFCISISGVVERSTHQKIDSRRSSFSTLQVQLKLQTSTNLSSVHSRKSTTVRSSGSTSPAIAGGQ